MTATSNIAIADKLRQMADVLEQRRADGYRVNAYRRAARTIEEYAQPIEDIVCDKGTRRIELPRIGRGIGAAVVEMVTAGRWASKKACVAVGPR